METLPLDPVVYVRTLRQTRRRRKLLFTTVLAYVPALYVIHAISPTTKAMGTFFGVWLLFLILATILVTVSKCPRCGNYFHTHGMTLLILRKCLHCQLHIGSDELPG